MLLNNLIYCGGAVMWPLLGLALISILIITDRIVVLCILSLKKGSCKLHGLRFVGFLELISQATPVIGFLGTVVGIMTTFKSLSEASAISIQSVSSGMNQALYTTAAGLIISLIDAVFAQLFRWWYGNGSEFC